MRLSGIELRNFRSIGDEPVLLRPWRKCNILVGKNNSGKSNAIRAIQRITDALRPGEVRLDALDQYQLSPENHFTFTLHFEADASEVEHLVRFANTESFSFEFRWEQRQRVTYIDNSLSHTEGFSFESANKLLEFVDSGQWPYRVEDEVVQQEFRRLGSKIFSRSFASCIPQTYQIPEFRQIRKETSEAEFTLSGVNLIEQLARYKSPQIGSDHEREKFDLVEKFVRQLLHLPGAKLDVTHDKSTITLENDGLRLPLSSYGTGVHELVIMITATLSIEDAICCIEEPEIHLHPTLQREFIEFITTETSNQYLISTHSPTLINAHATMPDEARENIQVFHLRLENGATVGGPVLEDAQSLRVLGDLGVKASDLLQANCILWVEGPSDRIYLKRWLELTDPTLIEGVHYSIMFYGGKLLSHVSVDPESIPEELIDLLKINQHAVVVMDSDRKKFRARLNETKLRVREECEKGEAICWVTDDREIENYLPPRVVAAACKELTGGQIEISVDKYERFEDALSKALKKAEIDPIDYSGNKVKYAKVFARHFEAPDMSGELGKRMNEVVEAIRRWNE